MSRFYHDLHDRELLAQAASVLQEAHERKLVDVFLPPDACSPGEETSLFPRRLSSAVVSNGRLHLSVEPRFFHVSNPS